MRYQIILAVLLFAATAGADAPLRIGTCNVAKIFDSLDERKAIETSMPVLTHLGPAAPAGLTRYDSEVFGPEYRDNLFSACFNLHKVIRHGIPFVAPGAFNVFSIRSSQATIGVLRFLRRRRGRIFPIPSGRHCF